MRIDSVPASRISGNLRMIHDIKTLSVCRVSGNLRKYCERYPHTYTLSLSHIYTHKHAHTHSTYSSMNPPHTRSYTYRKPYKRCENSTQTHCIHSLLALLCCALQGRSYWDRLTFVLFCFEALEVFSRRWFHVRFFLCVCAYACVRSPQAQEELKNLRIWLIRLRWVFTYSRHSSFLVSLDDASGIVFHLPYSLEASL